MVMGNVFLGIIVDALITLRKRSNAIENDKNNVCIICALTRDEAIKHGINFDKHIIIEHNLWSYVYFITYLRLNSPKRLGPVERFVKKLLEGDKLSWIPVQEKECDTSRFTIEESVDLYLNTKLVGQKLNPQNYTLIKEESKRDTSGINNFDLNGSTKY